MSCALVVLAMLATSSSSAASNSATVTVTATATPSRTATATKTSSRTATVTATRTRTGTYTATQTPNPRPVNIPRDLLPLHVDIGTMPALTTLFLRQAFPYNAVIRRVEFFSLNPSAGCTVGETVRFISTVSPDGNTWVHDFVVPGGNTFWHEDFDLQILGTAYTNFPRQPAGTPTATPGPDLQVQLQTNDCITSSSGDYITIWFEKVPGLYPTWTATPTRTASRTATATATRTVTATATSTPTASATNTP